MNFNSLRTKITLAFFFTLVLFIAAFLFYNEYNKRQAYAQINSNYEKISNYLIQKKAPMNEVISYMKRINFEVSQNPHEVIDTGKILFMKREFETIYYNKSYYFHFITPFDRILFKDLSMYKRHYYGHFIFLFIFIAMTLLYIWLMKSLKPLGELQQKISKFSKGDFDIACKSDKKDEIAAVTNEFDSAAKKIKLLLDSRQLFLRTIMHELKTPIAKGRIVSELIDDEKQKGRIITIFEKLNYLIDDFAKVEQIVSCNYKPTIYTNRMNDIVNKAIDNLMLENHDNILLENISDKNLQVDLDLLALAIKNLIDNGLKYSQDAKVTLKEEPNQLLIISTGKQLERELKEYYKPFHSDTQSKNHGMGLGLYIVHSIVQMHSMELAYEYKENKNIFKLIYSH